jgi:hypothetical protein
MVIYSQADRCELSSVSLFEGMIDRYGLGPFSSVPVKKDMSSFNAYPPIGTLYFYDIN